MVVTLPKPTSRPREITVAAIVAFIGSVAFAMAGLVIAGTVGVTILVFKRNYPGVSVYRSAPDFLQAWRIICLAVAIPILLGILGLFTARGLVRLRPWARKSAIVWSIVSTVLSLLVVAYLATLPSSSGPPTTPMLIVMLFLFPVNAWWLLLFFRPNIKSLFIPQGATPRHFAPPPWLKEKLMPKLIIAVAAMLLLVVAGAWAFRRNSPMREIERSRDALANVKSWHYHTVRLIPSRTPETQNIDFLCPVFEHSISSTVNDSGVIEVREQIRNFNTFYNRIDGRWVSGQQSAPIFECGVGPLGTDEYSLPLAGVIEDGSAKRGEALTIGGDSCREYEISVDTPHDPKEKTFVFTLCINEKDDLPRQSRRVLPETGQEGISTFSQFNAITTPQLPADIAP
jgi:hypothetical protein